jgi:NADPH-dependent 2,4-dienoyl-CoA reductase/sulfur reductase-like enzyme
MAFLIAPDYPLVRPQFQNRVVFDDQGTEADPIFPSGIQLARIHIAHIGTRLGPYLGSGDIGLIMARRMSWVGCNVKAVVEIMPYPAGLTRNLVQGLRDVDIPLYLSCQTTNVFGSDRVEGVEITPMENGVPVPEKRSRIDCDTVLLSVGLVPENELSKDAGVELHNITGGPLVDSRLMTSREGIFACGNVLHVHDLVDWVSEESRRAGRFAAAWLRGEKPGTEIRTKAGSNVRYVNPGKLDTGGENRISLRSLSVKNDAVLELRADKRIIRSYKKGHIQPSEMITLDLEPEDLKDLCPGPGGAEPSLEFSIL